MTRRMSITTRPGSSTGSARQGDSGDTNTTGSKPVCRRAESPVRRVWQIPLAHRLIDTARSYLGPILSMFWSAAKLTSPRCRRSTPIAAAANRRRRCAFAGCLHNATPLALRLEAAIPVVLDPMKSAPRLALRLRRGNPKISLLLIPGRSYRRGPRDALLSSGSRGNCTRAWPPVGLCCARASVNASARPASGRPEAVTHRKSFT